jgi:nucleoside-diphosphate-sugar epimerase
MSSVLLIGAGLVGSAVAFQLVARGDDVTVATRSGTVLPGCRAIAANASDAAALTRAAQGASTVFLCSNPPYPAWTSDWPPIFAATIAAATAAGTSLVAMGNLYPYGQATMPMTEHSAETTTESKGLVRAAGWAAMRAAHERGDLRAVEVRASDYFGPGATETAHLGARYFIPVLANRATGVVGDPDAAHSWAYLPDIAATLVAASDYTGDWGRVWHAPSSSNFSRRQIAEQLGSTARIYGYPDVMLRALGAVNPMMREVRASSYQFRSDFISDSTETERELGVRATPWAEALAVTADSYRQ